MTGFARTANCRPVKRAAIPVVPVERFRERVLAATAAGDRLVAFWGEPVTAGGVRLNAALASERTADLSLIASDAVDAYPSLTPDCAQAHWFEREIREQWGICPEGHPWLKPIRFQPPRSGGSGAVPRPAIGETAFYRVRGQEVHEVAVGPVHAGIIEPGHFRFNCHGERVFHLEISLGYQHRGVERALSNGADKRAIHYIETLAGDSTIGHALTYCQAVESLAGTDCSERAWSLRVLALELERIANHIGDLGALAGDIGYLPTAAYCGALRGDVLNLTAALCGNRLGRGLIRPGGTDFDADPPLLRQLAEDLGRIHLRATEAIGLLWTTSSVRARFENTGVVARETARELGLVGPAARASGIDRDVRRDLPRGLYVLRRPEVATASSGDVFARAWVRWREIEHAVAFLLNSVLTNPGTGAARSEIGPLASDCVVVSLTEGWRGEICHVLSTDGNGGLSGYKVIDPSFHNWSGLAMAMRGQQISDFPVCNKSFNLSYCGHDL